MGDWWTRYQDVVYTALLILGIYAVGVLCGPGPRH